MKLIDYLKAANKDEYIYLGASNGFVWIAKPDEMIAKLPELDMDYTERFREALDRTKTNISYYEKWLATEKSEYVINGIKPKLESQQRIKKLNEDKLEKRIPFANREIVDLYRRKMCKPFGTCVIVAGHEWGDYWTLEEQEEDNK